jgi:hypothetical protein
MEFIWKILEVSAKEGVITHARYHVIATQEDISVETEGNWYFDCPTEKVPFEQVTEEMIANWIENEAIRDGQCHIKLNIENQINNLKEHKTAIAPWLLKDTFTVE